MTGPGEQKISSEIEAGEVEDAPYVGEQEPGPFSGLANPLGGLFGQPKPAPPPEEVRPLVVCYINCCNLARCANSSTACYIQPMILIPRGEQESRRFSARGLMARFL